MNRILATICVATALCVVATLPVQAQSHLGPRFTYSISTGLGPDVTAYGAPVRFGLGALFTTRLSPRAEFSAYGQYRVDNGGFQTPFVGTASMRSGKLDVVEPGTGAPQVITTIETSSIEAGVMMGLYVARLDSAGSAIVINVGVGGDYVLSATQTDDYSNVPKNELGERPVTEDFTFESQVGFNAMFGVGLVLPLGSDRMLFEFGYAARIPTEFTFEGTSKTSDLGWLLGRGLRIGLAYQIGL
jgi:hypothetical protein